jgi:cysteine desulfurase/selenocysteine lyase
MSTLDLLHVRADFPMLSSKEGKKSIVYLDNAATTFKPLCVIEAMNRYYQEETATVHRGIYSLAEKATLNQFAVRKKVASFIGASSEKEIIFTSGTTASINLVALSWGEAFIKSGDEILVSEIEHHSNLVPWQMLAQRKGAILKFIPVSEQAELDLKAFKQLLNPKTKLVSLTHISNAFGVINPLQEIVSLIREHSKAKILIDAAQSAPHCKLDVVELDLDFLAFSAHKLYGPTGLGILYGKEELLNEMPPLFGGGDMIDQVTLNKTTYNELPYKFEAGTPNISAILGLGSALDYLDEIGLEAISLYEQELVQYAQKKLRSIHGITLLGDVEDKGALISFYFPDIHPLDIATLLNLKGIALRSGHLCAQPGLKRFHQTAVLRVSFSFYNTKEEIDYFCECLSSIVTQL